MKAYAAVLEATAQASEDSEAVMYSKAITLLATLSIPQRDRSNNVIALLWPKTLQIQILLFVYVCVKFKLHFPRIQSLGVDF